MPFSTRRFRGGFGLLVVAALSAAPAAATVLTFDIDGQASETDIPATYGDNVTGDGTPSASFHYLMGTGWTPDVAVEYATLNPSPQTVTSNVMKWYGPDYSTLNVAYPNGDAQVAEITFVPADGNTAVRIESFDLSSFQGAYDVDLIRITDAARGATLWSSSESNIGPAAETFTPAYTGLPGETLRLQFGSTWNVAFDNVSFSQVVPEPASATLLTLAAGCCLTRRRRTV